LYLDHEPGELDAAAETAREEEHDGEAGEGEEEGHLDAYAPAVEEGADCPVAALDEVERQPEEEGREAVVEAAEDEDAVETLGEDEQREEVRRGLRGEVLAEEA
jgi:hypothetical protein